MKSKVVKLENDQVKVTVTFDASEFDAEYDKQLDKVVKNHEEKGFRKGSYPKSRYVAKYGDGSVLQATVESLVEGSYYEIITSKKVGAIDQPEIDIDFENMGKGKPFTYHMTVQVFPEVTLGEYFGIEVEKESTEVTEKEVEDYVARELKNHSDLEVAEDKALENGDTAVFDFCGSVDGVEFPGGKAENYSLEIGSGQFIPGFEEQMVGMKSGEEKTIKVHFPADYHAEDLKDKDADFAITLHEIKVRVNPTLDDEFVKGLELEGVNNVAEWKQHLHDVLAKEKEEASKNKFESEVIEKICENATMNVPEVMVDREVNQYLKNLENQAKMYGLTLDVFMTYQGLTVEEFKQNYRPAATAVVKRDLVLDKIIQVEKIKLLKKDYDAYYKEMAEQYSMTVEQVKEKMPEERIKDNLLMKKAYDLVIEKAVQK